MYHYFLIFLDKSIYNYYNICYDYVRHNYFLYKIIDNKINSCFIINRTSEKCFRLSYYNNSNNIFIYKSFKSARLCANFVKYVFDKYS